MTDDVEINDADRIEELGRKWAEILGMAIAQEILEDEAEARAAADDEEDTPG